jgi:hypothetical protein
MANTNRHFLYQRQFHGLHAKDVARMATCRIQIPRMVGLAMAGVWVSIFTCAQEFTLLPFNANI